MPMPPAPREIMAGNQTVRSIALAPYRLNAATRLRLTNTKEPVKSPLEVTFALAENPGSKMLVYSLGTCGTVSAPRYSIRRAVAGLEVATGQPARACEKSPAAGTALWHCRLHDKSRKCKTLDRGGWRGRPCSLQRPKPRHPVGIDFTIVPSSSTKRDTSPFGTTLKFLVHTVLVQFLECVPIRRGEIGRFLRLQTQHATQIRDCFLVDQTLRAARTCYVARNSFRLPENSKATEQTPFSAVWPGRPR